MYSENPVINDIVLTIINDGDGKLCGMDYARRCAVADTGIFEYRAACREYGRTRYRSGSRPPTRQEVIEAATIIQEYYREHDKELLNPA